MLLLFQKRRDQAGPSFFGFNNIKHSGSNLWIWCQSILCERRDPSQGLKGEFTKPHFHLKLGKFVVVAILKEKRPGCPFFFRIQQHQAFRQQLVNLMPKYIMRKERPISRSKRWVYKTTFSLEIRKICCCCYFKRKEARLALLFGIQQHQAFRQQLGGIKEIGHFIHKYSIKFQEELFFCILSQYNKAQKGGRGTK